MMIPVLTTVVFMFDRPLPLAIIMAVLRIGVGLGIPFELTVVLPLVLALLAGLYFNRRIHALG